MYDNLIDIILLLTSSLACVYCFVLSRRLKKLQSLDTGLGASIISLTKAINETNNAARQAREATDESVTKLKSLLKEAEDSLPLIEARIESLRFSKNSAKIAHEELEEFLQTEVRQGVKNAQIASGKLLQIARKINAVNLKDKQEKV